LLLDLLLALRLANSVDLPGALLGLDVCLQLGTGAALPIPTETLDSGTCLQMDQAF